LNALTLGAISSGGDAIDAEEVVGGFHGGLRVVVWWGSDPPLMLLIYDTMRPTPWALCHFADRLRLDAEHHS
jgi:hypothetical protein